MVLTHYNIEQILHYAIPGPFVRWRHLKDDDKKNKRRTEQQQEQERENVEAEGEGGVEAEAEAEAEEQAEKRLQLLLAPARQSLHRYTGERGSCCVNG